MKSRLHLASTSPYRAELLGRLQIPFERHPPGVDEALAASEPPEAYVERLARAKAAAVGERFPADVIIGSDQCALVDGRILGKPGTPERSRAQLVSLAGHCVTFLTAVTVLKPNAEIEYCETVPYYVRFRSLTPREIERYVDADRPFDCAGAIRCESLGPALFESMAGDDPTALQGLPLIRLSAMLREAGFLIP